MRKSVLLCFVMASLILAGCQPVVEPPADGQLSLSYAGQWGSQSLTQKAQFADCAVHAGHLFGADYDHGKVIEFDSSGDVVLTVETAAAPRKVTVSDAGIIYTVEGSGFCQEYSAAGGFMGTRFHFNGLEDVAVDADGNIYAAIAVGDHLMRKYDSTGTFICEWGAGGTGSTAEPTFSYGPNGVAVVGSLVFVTDYDLTNQSSRCLIYNLDGIRQNAFATYQGMLNGGIAADGAGNLYLTSDGRVQRYIESSPGHWAAAIGSLGREGSGEGELLGPYGIALDPDGNVYVADYLNKRIEEFDSNGAYVRMFHHVYSAPSAGGLNRPSGVELDGEGNLLVVDSGNDRILKFAPDGDLLSWAAVPSLYSPVDVAAAQGRLYVLDSNRVQRLDAEGSLQLSWGPIVPLEDVGLHFYSLESPQAIAVGPSGRVIVANTGVYDILTFDADGGILTHFMPSDPADSVSTFGRPMGIAVDAQGRIYITTTNDSVWVCGSDGGFIRKWGAEGTGEGQFSEPKGIAVDADGNVFVVDSTNCRVQVFDPEGGFLDSFGSFGTEEGQLMFPQGIAVGADGAVYVSDTGNNRIVKLAASR